MVFSEKNFKWLVSFLFWGLLVLFFSFLILYVLSKTQVFSGIPINGAFQMLNPLYRLDHGFSVGKDFNFFHGIGTLFLHYPVYKVLGGGLWASETSTYLIAFFCINSALFLFFRSLKISKKLSILFVVLFLLTFFYAKQTLLFPLLVWW